MSLSNTAYSSGSRTGGTSGNTQEDDRPRDPRVETLQKQVLYADMTDDDQQTIMGFAIDAVEKYILYPTSMPSAAARAEERKFLERELERTNMRDIALHIKQACDKQFGPYWHVIYGRSCAVQVTHERKCFVHFSLDGSNVCVWKHGDGQKPEERAAAAEATEADQKAKK